MRTPGTVVAIGRKSPRISRGVGLGVPGVELALAAAGEDDEHRFRFAEAGEAATAAGRGAVRRRVQAGQSAEAQPFAAGVSPR